MPSLAPDSFQFILTLMKNEAGVSLGADKMYLVSDRLETLARHEGFRDVEDLITTLKSNSARALQEKVVDALTTHETLFFRDPTVFAALRQEILPPLLARRAEVRRFSIWCAAASTGQEPYSVAMMIREDFPHILEWDLNFLASDISPGVLQRAKRGLYTEMEVGRGLTDLQRNRFFSRRDALWQIDDRVRSMVRFERRNLVDELPLAMQFDVILMRNVLIYFDLPLRKEILKRVAKLLAHDGVLVLGSSEIMLGDPGMFKPWGARGGGIFAHVDAVKE